MKSSLPAFLGVAILFAGIALLFGATDVLEGDEMRSCGDALLLDMAKASGGVTSVDIGSLSPPSPSQTYELAVHYALPTDVPYCDAACQRLADSSYNLEHAGTGPKQLRPRDFRQSSPKRALLQTSRTLLDSHLWGIVA
jgi:hypothetical protein